MSFISYVMRCQLTSNSKKDKKRLNVTTYGRMDEDVDLEEALQSDVLFQELLKNEIFDDYFNTFLSLPIFARRLMYRRDHVLFEIEPPVKRTTHHLLHDKVISWIRIHRGPYFLNTSICNEYRLCRALAALPVCLKYDSVSDKELHQLQRKYLSRVIDIQRLKKYFNESIGEYLLQFWLDAERYRRQVPENCRKFVLREIQKKFLTKGATHALNISLLEKINSHLKEKMDKSTQNLSTILISPQHMVMKNLMAYWIPKYIIHRLRRRTTAVGRWGKLLKAKDKLPTEVSEDESGEKPHLITAVINDMKEKMKKKNEELRQKNSSHEPEISASLRDHVTSTSSNSGEEDEEVHKENGNQRRKQMLNTNKKKREKQKEMEDAISDLTITKNRVKTKRSKKHKKPTNQHVVTLSLQHGVGMKTGALSTTESSKESIVESPLTLPPIKASFAKDITKECNKATLFEALHVEKETAYEADIEEEADIGDSKLPRDELNLPVIDSFEKSLTSMMQPGSPPPQIVTPFSSSFVKGNELINSKDRGKQFQLLIAALTTDPIAGQPLISYFLKTGNEIAEHNLRFWTASNQVLTDIHNNDTVTRRKQYQVLINLYLSSAANTKVSLTCSAKQELCTLLLKDIGVTRLIETCKAIAETLQPYWEEFLQSDDDCFLKNTTKYKQNILHRGKRTNAFMFSCIGNSDHNETFGSGFSDEASNTRKEFRGSRMWRAMQLALAISIPKQAEPLSDAEESEGWTSDESVNETSEKVGGSLNIRNLHLLNRQAQRQNKGKLETLVNSTGLAHNYNGSFGYNKFGAETDDEFNHVAITEQRLHKASQIKLPRPRCFQDILSDVNQLEGFKRFLAKEDEETPLVFWVAVESMRTTCKTAKARQGRSYGIVKRYFGPSTQNGQDLKCNAEIIKDIPFIEKVTPAMLVSAQACVAKSIEDNWFLKYVQTFQDEGGVTGVTLLPIYGDTTTNEVVRCVKQKTRGLWRMFTRNVISFRRGIMHSDTLRMFCDFLRLQHSLNVAQFQASNIDNQNGTTASPKIVINNKLVHTEKLVKDLNFWSEVERYKDFADAVVLCAKLGNYTKDDELVVVKKAYTIVDCFIDSQIAPRVQINISNDLAENIINLVHNGIIERGLFHEAALSTFSTLIYFWKKFCLHRFLPKEQIPAQRKLLKSDRSTQIEIRQLALMSNKIKKIPLPPDEDCPKIMFSLQLGLRLALQRHNKRRKFDEQRGSETLNPGNTDNFSAPPSQHRSFNKIH